MRTKSVRIGDSVAKLYSLDNGKLWFGRPRDLRLFKLRKRRSEKSAQELMRVHIGGQDRTGSVDQSPSAVLDPVGPERALWLAVLFQAIQELGGYFSNLGPVYSARRWFLSEDYGRGSFRWICDELDFDARAIRRKVFEMVSASAEVRRTAAKTRNTIRSVAPQRMDLHTSRSFGSRRSKRITQVSF